VIPSAKRTVATASGCQASSSSSSSS
jgi:hypothetical protein